MISRNLVRLVLGILVCVAFSISAFAQCPYPPCGGGGAPPGGTAPTSGYGSGKAIGIGVGVAAGVGILVYALHHRGAAPAQASLMGCTQAGSDGTTLVNEKDQQTYTLVAGNANLKADHRVEVKGKKTTDGSGKRSFQVQKLEKDYGPCKTIAAVSATAPTN